MTSPLGDFLRLRRHQTTPGPHAMPGVRRTPGLRREEVAVAASVSVDYYSRLEQGRETNPSDAVLAAICSALNLPSDDLRHVIALRDAPISQQKEASGQPDIAQRMQRVVDAWASFPAYALNFRSDVVAANAAAYDLFIGLDDVNRAQRNTCQYLVTHPAARDRFVDWEEVVRASFASLRAHSTPYADDPALASLLEELRDTSPEFERWWDGYAVAPRRASHKRFRTLDGDTFTLDYEVMAVPGTDVRLSVYLGAVPDAPSRLGKQD